MNKANSSQPGIALAIILIIIAALVAGAGATYYFTDGFGRNTKDETSTSKTIESSQPANKDDQINESATGTDSLSLVKSAVAGHGSIKCVSKTKADGKHVITTMYIKDKDNIRMEIRTDMGTAISLLKDQTHSYTWSEGQSRGTKAVINKDSRSIEKQWQENINDAKNSGLKGISCSQTAVKDSQFAVPSNIKFSDLGQYTN